MVNYGGGSCTVEQAKLLGSSHPIVQLRPHHETSSVTLLAGRPKCVEVPEEFCQWWGPPYAEDLQDTFVRMQSLKARLSQFPEPFRTAWLALKDDEVLPIYPGQQWAPTMPQDNHDGRVTLAGDAAHSMLPNRGQGLNHALTDAGQLVDAIKAVYDGQQPLKGAITNYESNMKPRSAEEVAMSFKLAQDGRSKDSWKESSMVKIGMAQTEYAAT